MAEWKCFCVTFASAIRAKANMLTKFYLHYDDTRYELQDDDLYNWDQVTCSYKRANYDGVVRSFTSQFVFINQAMDILRTLYLRDRFNARATISVHTITDCWEWEQRFSCPLDFSTVCWENNTFKINAIDNSLGAMIKANKGSKYEFIIGTDIGRDSVLYYDRVIMQDNVTYKFTQGEQYEDNADIKVTFNAGILPWVGTIGDETSINGAIYWNDDQEDEPESYLLKAEKDIDVSLEYVLEWRTDEGHGGTALEVRVRRNGSFLDVSTVGHLIEANIESRGYVNRGTFTTPAELPDPAIYDNPPLNYCIIGGNVYEIVSNGQGYVWRDTFKRPEEYFAKRKEGKTRLSLKAGDEVVLANTLANGNSAVIRFVESKFVFSWLSRGEPVNVDVFTPKKIGESLLNRITDGKVNVDVVISDYDKRLSGTFLMAAESARGLSDAKFYSSFSEYCDWLSVVFGYEYTIGDPEPSPFRPTVRTCGDYQWSPWAYLDEAFSGETDVNNIVYIPTHARFMYHDPATGKLYTRFPGYEDYNHPETGRPRTDTIFRILALDENGLYYFDDYKGEALYPNRYDHPEESIGNPHQTVHFWHRSELMAPDADVRKITNVSDVQYKVDNSSIYSMIMIGYEKKDYGCFNGRDEFNFNITYTTGCSVTDKTLTLLSKYRCDCYGVEFAIQKRGEETTDSKSDSDVFFILCKNENGKLVPDRTLEIENAISDSVFNGAFSPPYCVMANAGLIGIQAERLTLSFASSEGNSDIVVGGIPMSGNLVLDTPLATSGEVEFSTDIVDDIASADELVEIVDDEGILYRGFLKEVDVNYTRPEGAKYKLIVKEIER